MFGSGYVGHHETGAVVLVTSLRDVGRRDPRADYHALDPEHEALTVGAIDPRVMLAICGAPSLAYHGS